MIQNPRRNRGALAFDFGVVTFSKHDDDDFIGVQVDAYGEQNSGMVPFEQHHTYGFFSRPLDPDADGTGCSVLYARQGNQRYAWLANDPRVQPVFPLIQKGEVLVYGAGGQFTRYELDGTITHYTTTNNTPNGQPISFSIGPAGLVFRAPWGTWRFDASGWHVRTVSGARHDMGGMAGLPAPFNAIGSYNRLRAGVVSVQGGATTVGKDSGALNETAVTSLVTALELISAALVAAGHPAAIEPLLPTISNIGKVS